MACRRLCDFASSGRVVTQKKSCYSLSDSRNAAFLFFVSPLRGSVFILIFHQGFTPLPDDMSSFQDYRCAKPLRGENSIDTGVNPWHKQNVILSDLCQFARFLAKRLFFLAGHCASITKQQTLHCGVCCFCMVFVCYYFCFLSHSANSATLHTMLTAPTA
jgi:hypothetical protein